MDLKATFRALAVVALCALGGGAAGLYFGPTPSPAPTPAPVHREPESFPFPHHVPSRPGGASLRFAMVHDVIHERYPRHGEAYYRERNRQVRLALAALEKRQPRGQRTKAYFELLDDLGTGLDHLKEHPAAIDLMADKLEQQRLQRIGGEGLYRTYANLGTFLIHGHFRPALANKPGAKEKVREGLKFIREAIRLNPNAHFGREVWQANAVAFLLAAVDRPAMLSHCDMVGNAFDEGPRDEMSRWGPFGHRLVVRPQDRARVAAALADDKDDQARIDARALIRHLELRWHYGGMPGPGQSKVDCVPFDEPTLGIIGMWRLGGGANPHFALALGEIMWRAGQRSLAWCAYERAILLAEQFWPDQAVQQQLVRHCRNRQVRVFWPMKETKDHRQRFQAELAFGQRYQRDYQAYEARRIREGARLDDPRFYEAFFKERGPIATVPGAEERYTFRSLATSEAEAGPEAEEPAGSLSWPGAVLGGGISAMVVALLLHWWETRSSKGEPCSGPRQL